MRGERRPATERGCGDCRGRVSVCVLGHDDADRAADDWPQGRMNDVPHRVQHRDLAHHELADVQHSRSRQNRRALQHRRYRSDVPEPAQQAEHEHRRVAVDTAGNATGEDQGDWEHPRPSSSPRICAALLRRFQTELADTTRTIPLLLPGRPPPTSVSTVKGVLLPTKCSPISRDKSSSVFRAGSWPRWLCLHRWWAGASISAPLPKGGFQARVGEDAGDLGELLAGNGHGVPGG